jgi:hypothetical protein
MNIILYFLENSCIPCKYSLFGIIHPAPAKIGSTIIHARSSFTWFNNFKEVSISLNGIDITYLLSTSNPNPSLISKG